MTRLAPILLLVLGIASANADIRMVAVSGRPAPGTDVSFATLNAFDLNNRGQVAIYGKLRVSPKPDKTPNDSGIWAERNGNLELVALSGDAIPESDDRFIVRSQAGQLRDDGTVDFFAGSFSKGKSQHYGFWTRSPKGDLRPVLTIRGIPPGFDNGTFAGASNGGFYNARGQVAFHAMVKVDEKDVEGVWVQNAAGDFELVTQRPYHRRHSTADYRYPLINDVGDVAFGHVNRMSSREYVHQPGNKNLIAIHGVAFPVVQRNDVVQHDGEAFQITRTSPANVNSAGQLAFFGDLSSPTTRIRAVLAYDPQEGIRLVALPGMDARGLPPGAKINLSSQRNYPCINRTGKIAFITSLADASGKRRLGVWSTDNSGLHAIAYDGAKATGVDGKEFATFSAVAINGHGQVAFYAGIREPRVEDPENRSRSNTRRSVQQGIWAQKLDGTLQLIVKPGDELKVGPNEVRRVQTAYLVGNTGNEDGRRTGFNDRGQIAFSALFADGTWGVFVSDRVSHDTPLPASPVDSRRLSEEQIEADPDVERRIVALEKRADEELEARRQQEKETDGFKLQLFADTMRAEFETNIERLRALKQHQKLRYSPNIEREIQSLDERQQLLESYWVELRTRLPSPPKTIPPSPSADFTRDAAHLMRTYGNSPKIHHRLAALMQRLEDNRPRQLVIQADRSTRPFDQGLVSAPFAKSIRPEPTQIDQDDSETENTEGLLAKVRGELGQLVGLKWRGKSLIVDRQHWNVPFGGQSRQEFLASLDRLLRSKGLSDDLMTRTDRDRMAIFRPPANEMNVIVLFMRLRANGSPTSRSSIRGGRGRQTGERSVRFSNRDVAYNVAVRKNAFRLEIDEQQLDQLLRIDGNDKNLHITLQSDQLVFDFRQSSRDVQLGYVTDEQTVRLKASSLADLYRKHPESVERYFYGFLRDLEIKPPLHRFDPSVTLSVLQQLRNLTNPDTDLRASELIDDLDHDVFSTRDAAAKELQANFQAFRSIVEREFADPKRSFEARRQLKRIIAFHARKHGEVDTFISSMRLVDDIPYLVALLQRVRDDDREIVGNQLRKLTKQELESDASIWRDWLKSNQQSE